MNTKINLHELLKSRGYDHGLISTFTFSPRFFEQYALERFKAISDNSNLTVFLDRGQYEEIIDSAAQKGWAPREANLRYLLHPIRVPGVFHPKVFLFANAKRGLLVIGSANFSQDGLGGNAEMVSIFQFELDKDESAQPLFQSAFQYFEDLVDRWPRKETASNVNEVRRSVPWLTEKIEGPRDKDLPILLNNLEEALWPQLLSSLPGELEELSLVSRFFDATPRMLDSIFGGAKSAKLNIFTQSGSNTLSPEWLKHPSYGDGQMKIYLSRYEDEEHSQSLHAKAYGLRSGKQMSFACGSANFSTSALLRPAKSGNAEVLLLYPPSAMVGVNLRSLFDPLDSAMELKDNDQLGYVENVPTEPVSRSNELRDLINEAVLDEDKLVLDLRMVADDVQCRISPRNMRPVTLHLKVVGVGEQKIELAPNLARNMAMASSVVQLGHKTSDGWQALSSPVLVVVPYSDDGGKRSKQHRRLQEAIESPQRFMNILQGLCESDDETRLRNFLTHCDIPIELIMKGMRKRGHGSGASTGPPTEFKDLGMRNLRHFNELHDATMSFLSRHRSKLEKHVECGTASGIPNYLHILESMLRLLHSQIERAAVGLESEKVLANETWKKTRDNISDYYRELGSLLRLTTTEYVAALLKEDKRAVVCEGFDGSADEILFQITKCLELRNRIDSARKSLQVKVKTGIDTTPAMFFHTQISDEKWGDYVATLKALAGELREQLSA